MRQDAKQDEPARDPIAQARALTPRWMSDIHTCDGLEIHPVRELTDEDDGSSYCEQCEPHEAQFWSVYGHLKEGGVLCLEDFPSETEARAFAQTLLSAWPHLRIFGLLE